MTLNLNYTSAYHAACERIDFVVQSLTERPGRAVLLAADKGGEQAVQAMFDAVMDQGHREVLVQALNSPAMPQWIRDRLETFLYGTRRQAVSALLRKQMH